MHRAAPPSNDNFASRISIAGVSGSVAFNTEFATREVGEPNFYPFLFASNDSDAVSELIGDYRWSSGPSVWYTYTATANGTLELTIDDAYHTQARLYREGVAAAASMAVLVGLPRVLDTAAFSVVGGTRYAVQVDGFFNTVGASALRWQLHGAWRSRLPLQPLSRLCESWTTVPVLSSHTCSGCSAVVSACSCSRAGERRLRASHRHQRHGRKR